MFSVMCVTGGGLDMSSKSKEQLIASLSNYPNVAMNWESLFEQQFRRITPSETCTFHPLPVIE